jgi:hypothetical protein
VGLEFVIGFIEHLQIVTTSNYGAMANSHNLQLTTAPTKSFLSAVFACRLVPPSNAVDPSTLVSRLQNPRWLSPMSPQLPS